MVSRHETTVEKCVVSCCASKQKGRTILSTFQLHARMITTSQKEELEAVGELSSACSQNVLKCLLWHELMDLTFFGLQTNLHEQSQDKRLVRSISSIHHTNNCRHHCDLGNETQLCRLEYLRILILLETCRFMINIPRNLLHLWKSNFCSISWMCKKQTSVIHSSTESEFISLDAGLRIDGILLLICGMW